MRKGFKSLLQTDPLLCKEWHYDKNHPLTPDAISFGNSKKVWWKCKNGHEWIDSITHRTSSKRNCPICRRFVSQEKSFGIQHPKIASEWNYAKNKHLSFNPFNLSAGSGRKVWWICNKNHEWEAEIKYRILSQGGCPYCSHHIVCPETSLAFVNPVLAKEWHPTKNDNRTPNDVTYGSSKKVWWKCSKGHEWQAVIGTRNNTGCKCPKCKKIILRDGEAFSSMVEAYYYIIYRDQGRIFKHDKKYPNSKLRYDFYFPQENKYVEVTSYNKRSYKKYFRYLRKIVMKKRYVEKVLGAKFQFIKHEIRDKQISIVKQNILQ
jgi:hypothetical protein